MRLKKIIMEKFSIESETADRWILECREEINRRLEDGRTDEAYHIMEEYFGLEPDYLFDIIG